DTKKAQLRRVYGAGMVANSPVVFGGSASALGVSVGVQAGAVAAGTALSASGVGLALVFAGPFALAGLWVGHMSARIVEAQKAKNAAKARQLEARAFFENFGVEGLRALFRNELSAEALEDMAGSPQAAADLKKRLLNNEYLAVEYLARGLHDE